MVAGIRPWLHPLALALLVSLVFLPALRNGFVWDDINNLLVTDRLHHWSSILEVFVRPAMWSADLPTGGVGTYRPIALASFVLDHKLGGGRPQVFHLTSVLLHVLSALLLRRLFVLWMTPGAALVLAVLWAIHPTAVEAVGWINGRSEIFASLFGTAALLVSGQVERPRPWRCFVIALLLLLALMGKESAVVFLPMILLLASIPRTTGETSGSSQEQASWRRPAAGLWVAVFTSATVYLLLRGFALRGDVVPTSVSWTRVAQGVPALWMRALQTALLPLDRAPITISRWIAQLSPLESTTYALASALILVGAIWLWRRKQRLAVMGLIWWALGLFPASFVVVSAWPGLARWLYIPLPGLLLAVQQVVVSRVPTRALSAVAGLMLVAFVGLTLRSLPAWKNDATLFAAMIEESPDDPFGYKALGTALFRVADYGNAAALFERALELGGPSADVSAYLALSWAHLGRCDEAARTYPRSPGMLVNPARFREALARCHLQRQQPGPAGHNQ